MNTDMLCRHTCYTCLYNSTDNILYSLVFPFLCKYLSINTIDTQIIIISSNKSTIPSMTPRNSSEKLPTGISVKKINQVYDTHLIGSYPFCCTWYLYLYMKCNHNYYH